MKNIKFMITLLVGFLIVGCSSTNFNHEYIMRGQVVELNSMNTIVCIGTYDGAKVGQKLNVLRFIKKVAVAEGEDTYKVENVGEVKVIEIINEHFAKVESVSGEIQKNDIVELGR